MSAFHGTIQITEVIWTVAGIPGLIVWLVNLRNAIHANRVVARSSDSSTLVLARVMVRLAIGAVTAESTFILWGIVGMCTPPVTERITATGWAVTVGVLVVASVTMFIGFDIRRAMVLVWRLSGNQQSS